jgi:hypothetical protein
MPTWYLLFLATWASVAVLRWNDSGGLHWALISALLAGLAVTVKQTGVLTVAGVLVATYAVDASRTAGLRLSKRNWALIAASALTPSVLFLSWYAARGAAASLWSGAVTAAPNTAAVIGAELAHPLQAMGYGTAGLALVVGAAWFPVRPVVVAAVAGAGIAVAALAMMSHHIYLVVWYAVWLLGPAALVLATQRWREAIRHRTTGASAAAVVAPALAFHLGNFVPYPAPNYFAYVAPLALLLAAMLVTESGAVRRATFAVFTIGAFGTWYHRIGGVGTVGYGSVWWDDSHSLDSPHAGLRVTHADSAVYATVLQDIAAHGTAESFVAGPELPATYALAGTQRVVAQPYLLGKQLTADVADLRASIDTGVIRVVIINDAPIFLPTIEGAARDWLRTEYPHARRVGQIEIRWR